MYVLVDVCVYCATAKGEKSFAVEGMKHENS